MQRKHTRVTLALLAGLVATASVSSAAENKGKTNCKKVAYFLNGKKSKAEPQEFCALNDTYNHIMAAPIAAGAIDKLKAFHAGEGQVFFMGIGADGQSLSFLTQGDTVGQNYALFDPRKPGFDPRNSIYHTLELISVTEDTVRPLAVMQGRFATQLAMNQNLMNFGGRFIISLVKTEGQWKIVSDVYQPMATKP